MVSNSNAPVFAGRYRFEPVGNDWDRGRSGFTHLVFDLTKERLGVIKRAETISKRSTEGLKNEVNALGLLKGLGVPEVYDVGQTEYGSKDYNYMVMEYVEGIRVEKNLESFTVVERAKIITKFFGVLSQAHQRGIVNGDVDLKHLFWRTDKKQLIVIDWGNAKLEVDPKKKTEFAYDLARAAEIIFSLVTLQGHPPATGSIALPDDSALLYGLGNLPLEFRELCKWAPRTPSERAQAPYTAQELFEISKKWLEAISSSAPYVPPLPRPVSIWPKIYLLIIPVIFGVLLSGIFVIYKYQSSSTVVTATSIILLPETPSLVPSNTPFITEITLPTDVPIETVTPTPIVIPSPRTYSPILTFDKSLTKDKFIMLDNKDCWKNEPIPPSELILNDGFFRRTSDDYWGFRVQDKHLANEVIQVDFSSCLGGEQVDAFALNVAVTRLQPKIERPLASDGREFGFFIEGKNGHRREYTLWIDQVKAMHLRIREDTNIVYDEIILVVSPLNLQSADTLPIAYKFPVQIFFEINNQGLDILYLLDGRLDKPIDIKQFSPNQMIVLDKTILSTLGDSQKVGLIGYGGPTETEIWPLVLLKEEEK